MPSLRSHEGLKKFQPNNRAVPGDPVQIDSAKIADGFINTPQLTTVLALESWKFLKPKFQ